jgi:putative transposase
VDTQRLVLKVKVHEAGLHDKEGAKLLLAPLAEHFPRMMKVWVDYAYRGLGAWLKETLGWELEVVKHWWTGGVWVLEGQELPTRPVGFQVLPRRWVVERTFGWLGRNRRLSRDYEFLAKTQEALIYLGMVRLMLRRLAKTS